MASQLNKYKNQILKDLKLLPEDKIKEVINFIGYLKNRENKKIVKTQRIISDPKILSGKPIIKGTRIPIYLILELLENGYTPKRIIEECYPELTEEDIKAVIHYTAELTKNEPLIRIIQKL